jgi:hypothetical protein
MISKDEIKKELIKIKHQKRHCLFGYVKQRRSGF